VRLYRPAGIHGTLPVMDWIHPGGMIAGDLGTA
jgi:acetyl esterase/lipase